MGLSGISIAQLLILLIIVMLVFGTKRLSEIGNDLGKAVKNFRKAMQDIPDENKKEPVELIEKDKQ